MKNSRFIKILKTFTREEFKQFGKFINSPFFNTNKTFIKLYGYLKKCYPEFGNTNEARVFKYIYPESTFNKKRIRDISSEMLKLCELYLSYKSFSSDEFNININLLKEINPRNIPGIFQHYYNLTKNKLNKNLVGDDFYIKVNTLNKELLKFNDTYAFDESKKNIQLIMNHVVKTSAFEILRCYMGAYTLVKIYNTNFDFSIQNMLMVYLKNNKFSNDPLIETYCNMIALNTNNNVSDYFKVKKFITENSHTLANNIKKKSTQH